ncbi:MAG: insulinase family protein [candidate division Zixibacteria bacterium]|nr:insulinase family protein [candidate division Zixibacteria bacterium]
MRRNTLLIGYFLIGVMCLIGVNGLDARTIDNLKYPPLNEIKMPDVEKIALDNGITLYILEDHELPIVRASVRLAAGAYLEPAELIGLAGITGEVMRTGGTAAMTGDEIDETLEAIGASVEVGIDNISGYASMNILSDHVDTGLEILAGVLRTPQFNEDKIELAKTARRTEISSRNDDPFTICIREFKKVIYGTDSPYARHTEYATINAITRDDLIAFHNKFVTPENVMIAIWGDFKKNEMIDKIRQYFGDWAPGTGKVPKLPEVTYEFKNAVHYIEKEKVTQSTVLMGHIGGLTNDPDYFALTVANNVLSGGAVVGGRMVNEIRTKRGLAYSTGSNYTSNLAYPGIYYNFVITKLESTIDASKAILEVVENMKVEPPTPEELQQAKDAYLNSFVFNFDSKGEVINRMMTYDYYGYPQDFLFKVKEGIEKVTAEDVRDVAKRRFQPDKMHIMVVGLADQLDAPLSELGPVDTIDITIPTGHVEEEVAVTDEALARGMDLLKKAAKACGGAENFKKVTAIAKSSDLVLSMPQGDISMGVSELTVYPDKTRQEINTPMGKMVTVSTADGGWMQQGSQVMEMGSEELESGKEEDFRSTMRLFRELDDPKFQAVYVATEEFNGKTADILNLKSLEGDYSFKLALDAETHMPLGQMYFGETMMGPANLTVQVGDYREINGVKVPFSVSILADGKKTMQMTVKDCQINPDIPAGAFDKP